MFHLAVKSRIYCRIDALKAINTAQRHLDNKHRQLILPICTRFIANLTFVDSCRYLQSVAELVYVPPLISTNFSNYEQNILHPDGHN